MTKLARTRSTDGPSTLKFAHIRVHVSTRAHVERVAVEGERVRVWVKAPPVEGRANRSVESVIARSIRISNSCVEIVAGRQSTQKTVNVMGLELKEVMDRLRNQQ